MDGDSSQNIRHLATLHRLNFRNPPREIDEGDRLCSNCHKRILGIILEDSLGNNIHLKVVVQQHGYSCIICGEDMDTQVRLSIEARIKVFLRSEIYLSEYNKYCRSHLNPDGSIPQLLCDQFISIEKSVAISPNEAAQWFKLLRVRVVDNAKTKYQEIEEFDDEDFKTLTSITKDQFLYLFRRINTIHCDHRTVSRRDLVMFRVKLRQGLSDNFLKVMFSYSSRQSVSMTIATVRIRLMQHFVPMYLGFGSMTRQQYIDRHVTDFSNRLYNRNPETKKAIIIVDGTYMYIPKSSNYRFLRQTFCVHKGRHLVKPIMLVAPDGYIIAVHGPYFADGQNNDASCLKDDLENDISGLKGWLEEEDIFIVDRGYRDCIEYLQSIGIQSEMPKYLEKGLKQHSAEEANQSRLVTKTRWVVESRNGHIRSIFKFFRDVIPMHHVANIGDFFRIACALINAYYGPIGMVDATSELAKTMLDLVDQPNVVLAKVEVDKLRRKRTGWVDMTAIDLPGFPTLREDYIRNLTLGIYQIKLARSYVHDKVSSESDYIFQICLEEPGLLRARLYSRFKRSTKYNVWIAYIDTYEEDEADADEDPIQGYYCECKSGARTLGCCAHVASVIWYLGYARYNTSVKYPRNHLLEVIRDCADRELPQMRNANMLPQLYAEEDAAEQME